MLLLKTPYLTVHGSIIAKYRRGSKEIWQNNPDNRKVANGVRYSQNKKGKLL
jgi:hypothetical protein